MFAQKGRFKIVKVKLLLYMKLFILIHTPVLLTKKNLSNSICPEGGDITELRSSFYKYKEKFAPIEAF